MSNIGRLIYGYCGGFFDDSYHTKRIESEGIDWVVARGLSEDSRPEFASFDGNWSKQKLIDEWATSDKQREEEEEWTW